MYIKKQFSRFLFTLIFSVLFFCGNSFSQSWNAIGSGTNGKINAVTVFNGQLIAAGEFNSPATNIARWNGNSWTALGSGLNGVVHALTVFNNNLIAVGAFNNAGNNVAQWNGTSWSSLGLGTNDTVFAATVYNNTLRIGGKFTTAGGLNCNRVSFWNGTQWGTMGTPNGVNNTVYALTVFNADLIIGGQFTTAGSLNPSNRVVRYNTNGTYTNMGSGIDNNQVLCLTVYQNQLYVGGTFSTIGGVPVNNIARWTGANWNTVGTGTNGAVRSFGLQGSNLRIGGSFTNIGNSIANWNGTAYSTLGTGITGGSASVRSISVWSNVLIAAGEFTTAGLSVIPASNIAGYGSVPLAPTLISPPDGANGVSTTTALDWSDVSGATTYGVQVSTNPNFTSTVINVNSLATSTYTILSGVLANNVTYFWRANASNGLGTSPFSLLRFFTTALVGIINTQEIPLTFNLYQNYPNPFNPVTNIKFDIPAGNSSNGNIKLVIYDINGKEISVLLNEEYTAGIWEVDFNAVNLPSGLYFYKLTAGSYSAVNKMILIK
jgi:hypothetical protein